ncbi:MAG: hypothetical protein ACI8QT_000092 [Halioglobus sp.]
MQSNYTATLQKQPLALVQSMVDTRQFLQITASASWYRRDSPMGSVRAIDPVKHGEITGQICEYFSQPKLLQALSGLAGIQLDHFVGNIITCSADSSDRLSWMHPGELDAGVALAVNIGTVPAAIKCLQDGVIVDFQPGDAVIMALEPGQRSELVITEADVTLIEGFLLKN